MIEIRKRWVAIFPFVCSLVTFTLSLIILFAGNKPGYMEDMAIIRLNVSMIGANLFGAIGDIPGLEQFSDSLGGLQDLLGRRDDLELVRRQLEAGAHRIDLSKRGLLDGDLGDIVDGIGGAVSSAMDNAPTQTPAPKSGSPTTGTPTTTTAAGKDGNDPLGDILDGLPIPSDIQSKIDDVIPSNIADITSLIPTAVPTSVDDITDIVDTVGDVIPGASDLIDKINATIPGDIRDTITSILGDIQNFTGTMNLTDGLADELGLDDWYSLHLMGGCQGKFTPNPIAANAGINVTECTPAAIGYKLNITEMLDRELGIGPFHVNLAQLQFPDAIQGGLDIVNKVIASITYAYIFGVVMAAINMVGSAAAFCLRTKRSIAAVNLVASLLGTLALLGGSLVTTLISHGGGALVNLVGKAVGISASPGKTFVMISWASVMLMSFGFVYWVVELTVARFKARVARIRARVIAELAKEGRLRDPEEVEMLRRQEQGYGEANEGDDDEDEDIEAARGSGEYTRDEKAMMQQQLEYIDSKGGDGYDGYDEDGDYDEDSGYGDRAVYQQQSPPGYDEQGYGGQQQQEQYPYDGYNDGSMKPKKKKKKGTM